MATSAPAPAPAPSSPSVDPPPPPPPPSLHHPIPNPTLPPPSSTPPRPPFPPSSPIPSSQPSDHLITIANLVGYPIPSGMNPAVVGLALPAPSFGFLPDHQPPAAVLSVPFLRPPLTPRPAGNTDSGAPRGVPAVSWRRKVAQVATMPSAFNSNRDKSKNHAVLTFQDRKVRLSDAGSGSLYALCRSWVRNGLPQGNQPQIGEGVKLLPRPLPTTVPDLCTLRRDEDDDEDKLLSKEERDVSVENLSARDLLDGHIKRAKRVRTRLHVYKLSKMGIYDAPASALILQGNIRLREERLQRIDRYRQRLSLLLPSPPAEQGRTDDAATSS